MRYNILSVRQASMFQVARPISSLDIPADGWLSAKRTASMPVFEPKPQHIPKINRQIRYPPSYNGKKIFLR